MKRLALLLLVLMAPGVAEGHTLPYSLAKTRASKAVERHWKAEGFYVLDRPALRCRRLSAHKIRCKASLHLEDAYGCGRAEALVSVRTSAFGLITRVARDVWHPFYDLASLEYDAKSCSAYGF